MTIDEVIRVMKLNNGKAYTVLQKLLAAGEIWRGSSAPKGGLVSGLFMPKEAIPKDKQEWVELLMQE